MNVQVEVTWRILRTVAHSLMVHAKASEACVHFALMYTTDHIFPFLPIKDIINEDGYLTTPHKLVTGTKPSVSQLCVLFFPCFVRKATEHVETKALNIRHETQKWVLLYLSWYSTASKMISCVCTQYKKDNIFI